MIQRSVLLFLSLTAALSLLTACTGNQTKVAGESAPAQPAQVEQQMVATAPLSPWEEAYDTPQENTPNTIGSDSSEFLAPIATMTPTQPVMPVTDVWQRIRNGLTISDYTTLHKDSQQQLKWFAGHPDYMARVVERARPYLHYIVEQVDKRGLPMEVALLPVVESGFKPNAYSKSHAAGLWQFIPGTGKVYGLEQNWWYDGRRDVVASTDAALNYLEKLYHDFGDWQLAFAAYNCGEGTVARAIKRNQKQGKPIDFWSLKLPRETSAYVPKLMAVSHLVKFPEQYQLDLSPIDNKPYLGMVDIGSQIDLNVAAKMAKVDMDTLYLLNPGFNRWATAPEGPHRLVLPLDKVDTFKAELTKLPKTERVQWARHKIKSGESLSTIAARYHTQVSVIKKANQLGSNTIRAGRHLLIPVSAKAQQVVQQQASIKPTGEGQTYTVQNGDTWWDIARAHGTNVKILTSWNGVTPQAMLKPGQQLVLHPVTNNDKKPIDYTIQQGDSLWAISRKFNVSVAQVREWNGLNERSLLQPGQRLKLYLEET